MGGPDLDGIWALATHTGRPVIASGGVRGHDDLRAIAALGDGIEGAVIGRALYEGLDLAEAIAAVA
jgi:phosphoribosylformimino-5-aminoimidazole carboxamide ribonucleotide (ProFAR) isomerase